MRPGRSVRPDRSMTSAWAGQAVPARPPSAAIRSPSMTTAASGMGGAPVPSMRVAPSRTCMLTVLSGAGGEPGGARPYSSPAPARRPDQRSRWALIVALAGQAQDLPELRELAPGVVGPLAHELVDAGRVLLDRAGRPREGAQQVARLLVGAGLDDRRAQLAERVENTVVDLDVAAGRGDHHGVASAVEAERVLEAGHRLPADFR